MIAQLAAQGYWAVGTFLPIHRQGRQYGQPLEGRSTGMFSGIATCQLFLQANRVYYNIPVETKIFACTMTMNLSLFSATIDYTPLLQGLQLAAAEGFSLTCILDNPNAKNKGFASHDSTLSLVCQRPIGQQVPAKQYACVSVPFQVRYGMTSATVNMDALVPTLDQHYSSGYKLTTVYQPQSAKSTGMTSHTAQLVLVFEVAECQYQYKVQDSTFLVQQGFSNATCNHSNYQNLMTAFAQAGWEISGVIDVPAGRSTGMTSMISDIKLLMQAPYRGDGVLAQSMPIAKVNNTEVMPATVVAQPVQASLLDTPKEQTKGQ